ncbi:Malignant fibrous histiocytoma-amplified sequence 1 [Hondaea fermentalgiana]|uniref:Malignant fibrous histiocytoma-amplified sequence 1 n=1 Tax=Hondaea fermentalgiana TaxID=2315210 RepID=A0A2R5GQ10_9STRA|nr:Malignant fibrous histiocytoma-amplified sequence 1 [Hondaea fermentalgiana]|eukprot:GBG32966.1 Malignant fibrous histiocytoma-amplified sequence 1 [Hondaea fermentalgiana]
MKHLVELDISHNALPVLHLDFCAASLRVLRAGHCDLDSAALSALKSCAYLEHVDLGSNRLGDPAAIRDAVVCFRKQIRVFRVEGNPIGRIELDELLAWLKQQCPCLSELDGAAQLHTFSRAPGLADLNLNSEADGIMVQDGASCSCIEGNPCAVPYNCKDWENRIEIARRARAELGYQTTK